MSDYRSTLHYLYGLQSRGIKFGLRNIAELLAAVGNPHTRFPSIHVGGTNGKGSTAAMVAAVCTAAGYTTALYTSPHLVRFTERIRINGEEISEKDVVRITRLLRETIEQTQSTFFEATTAIAFQYFAEKGVDIAVIEVGLGGRYDATNVIVPRLSIITSLALEHTDMLGTRIEQIAGEKGGIIKHGVPVLVGSVPPRAMTVLRRIAEQRKATMLTDSRLVRLGVNDRSPRGTVFDVKGSHPVRDVFCSLAGKFQENNIALALTAVQMVRRGGFRRINNRSLREGLAHVQDYSGLRGRFETLPTQPLVVMDVAHNPHAVQQLVESMLQFHMTRTVTVFGVMKDKDMRGIVSMLGRVSRLTIAVGPDTERAMEPAAIVRLYHASGLRCVNGGTVRNGVALAMDEARTHEPILITGSHYVVGEFLREYAGEIT